MRFKEKNGFIGIDMVVVIITFISFSTLLLFLIRINLKKNVDLKYKALLNIYATEILENIAITDFFNIKDSTDTATDTAANIGFLPEGFDENGISINNDTFEISIEVKEIKKNENDEPIAKVVSINISYKLDNKTYSSTLERIKLKE